MNKYGKGSVAYYGDINAETEKGDVRQEQSSDDSLKREIWKESKLRMPLR